MKTREDILAILAKQKPDWERQFRVRRLALFGSYARGDQQPESDVDILVEVDPSIGLQFVSLAEAIEGSLGLPVDVVSRGAVTARHWRVIEPELIDV
jgi:predicted nucleotidyltransferase